MTVQASSGAGLGAQFPPGFRWGVATASYQIEGGVTEGGRGQSIWDAFCHQAGRIADASTGEVACDHYHRWPEDVALMADLGVDAYRFSIAWPRIQPDGAGPLNQAGVDFYSRLIDGLREHGIAPVVTLYHWDLPQRLEDTGGWLNRDTAARFADYAGSVADVLGDRVDSWITLNEPVIHTLFGYAIGLHAPGRALLFEGLPAAHHQLLGHGLAVQAMRSRGVTSIGIANNHTPVWPATEDPADLAAANYYDTLHNRLFADPVLRGRYPDPADAPGLLDHLPAGAHEDAATIGAPLDFYGVNYYLPTRVKAPSAPDLPVPFELDQIKDYPLTAMDWPVVPDGLRETLANLKSRYAADLPPVLVTESGCAYPDRIDANGQVSDPERIDYLAGHIDAVAGAIQDGIDVRGYFVWSIIDNFEWAEGYTKRFGLVYVDYPTQRRTPKASYHWYREVIRGSR